MNRLMEEMEGEDPKQKRIPTYGERAEAGNPTKEGGKRT